MMMIRGELPRNTGTDGDSVAQIAADHFEKCPVCLQWFDIRTPQPLRSGGPTSATRACGAR
jgi:hypothetical protein